MYVHSSVRCAGQRRIDSTEHLVRLHLKDVFLCLVWQRFLSMFTDAMPRLLHSTVVLKSAVGDSASLKERPLPASLPTALTPGLLKVPFALIFSVLTCDVYSLV